MQLKTELLLIVALTSLVFFGGSAVVAYWQATEFFTQHEMRIQQGGEKDSLLAAFRQERQALAWELSVLHISSVFGMVATLSVALNRRWERLVSQPIRLVLDRMSLMSRGTWTQPIPVGRPNEVGRLIREFNLLGPRLTFIAHQYATASKLAAMALIGQRVTRRSNIARTRLLEIQDLLSDARECSQIVPQAAVRQVAEVAKGLADLAADLESDFNDQLVHQGLRPPSTSDESGRTQNALIAG
jgi:methyl-accepting chemotaxis protein